MLRSRLGRIGLCFVPLEPCIVPQQPLSGEYRGRVLPILFRVDRPEIPVYIGQQIRFRN